MGFFGRYVFDGRTWHDIDPGSDQTLDIEAPWLSVDIYDSDFATVRCEPPGPGSGTAYLGNTPRTYFGNESASAPTDVLREADGLASWLAQQQGNIVSAKLPELIASFLASDSPDEQLSDDVDLGDADIFVEIEVSQFLRAVGLSVPRELPSA
jgi:hypothetical protein